MARFSFSKSANFGIHIPLLILNLLVVGGLVWDTTPDTQNSKHHRILLSRNTQDHSEIFANHHSHVTPVVSLVATSIATVYTVVLLLLASFNVIIPALPRIIIDSAILWPAHLTSLIVIGAWNDWSALKQIAAGKVGPSWSSPSWAQAPLSSRQLTCSDPTWTTEMCAQRWKAISIVQTLVFAFGGYVSSSSLSTLPFQ